jgi:peroxiredoxin
MPHDAAPDTELENPAPETMEGWYVLHDGYRLDWARWRAAEAKVRAHAVDELLAWNGQQHHVDEHAGDSALYTIVGQKADLAWVHYRRTPSELAQVERSLRACAASDFLIPCHTYLSVIEASLYEATAIAHGMLARRGLTPGKPAFEDALAEELERQREHLTQRIFRRIPEQSHICIYPMNKRRGEHVNWYDMPLEERRKLMRSHGKLGRKYVDRVTQVVSGSVGLDAWEWMVDLHADDPLQFKKLIYEMRFDPASARFAEFGDFLVGIKRDGDALRGYLTL